ncbi:capsid protein [Bat associated circovirus 1]|uniref:Capsid protein n=1 Tax=Bat associated circovirus 1 TaxID=1868218 RepID=R4L9E4_9CIRC|nr:capsid protein [Bat associated circovirus 1]AGL09970.1 capsid protein [Bat associated circovirus 1]
MPIRRRSRYSRRRRWRRNTRRRRVARGAYRWRRKNGIINVRLSATKDWTMASTTAEGYNVARLEVNLRQFMPAGPGSAINTKSIPWAYYRIRKMKFEILPKMIPAQTPYRYGSTAIYLGMQAPAPTQGKTYDPHLKHVKQNMSGLITDQLKRYFTPKPDLDSITSTAWFQPNNKANQVWINMTNDNITHGQVGWSMERISNMAQNFKIRVTLYVQFREFNLIDYPAQAPLLVDEEPSE